MKYELVASKIRTMHFVRSDIVSYLVDCLCFSREEAEQMTCEQSFEEYLTRDQIEQMRAFLGILV